MKTRYRQLGDIALVEQSDGHFRVGTRGARPKPYHPTSTAVPQAPLTVTIPGNCPSGKNQVDICYDCDGKERRIPDKVFTAWRTRALQDLALALRGRRDLPLRGALIATVIYTPGDARCRDVPGVMDALWHLLERGGLVENDGQIRGVIWTERPVDGALAGVVLTLEPIP